MDTEPIQKRGGATKPSKTTNKEVRQNKYLAILKSETENAKGRLCPIIFRKEGGGMVIWLCKSTLERLEGNPSSVSAADKKAELLSTFYEYLDQEGLVNHRVIESKVDRLAAIKEIVTAALAKGHIEVTTKVSRLKVELSQAQMEVQRSSAKAHKERLVGQRSSRRTITLATR